LHKTPVSNCFEKIHKTAGKVNKIVEQLCGFEVSSGQVSPLSKELDVGISPGFEVSSGQVSPLSKELDVGISPNQESCLRLITAVL